MHGCPRYVHRSWQTKTLDTFEVRLHLGIASVDSNTKTVDQVLLLLQKVPVELSRDAGMKASGGLKSVAV